MRVQAGGYPETVLEAADAAAAAEQAGFDLWWAPETKLDALIGCAAGAMRTERIKLATGITVAFARNPMVVAQAANDLQTLSRGRFVLGLGSQIKPHITKRFSMPWSHPAPRMREFILAVRAIWEAWRTGEPLAFQGDFYTHTLSSPFFAPPRNEHDYPAITLASVGPKMTETAGEVADGYVAHAFQTERYLREVTLPALRRGRERSGLTLQGFEVSGPPLIVAGDTESERAAGIDQVRGQLAFYGSTPAYRSVLELHGLGELHERLHALTRQGRWDQLAAEVDDDVLHTFAVIGTPEEIGAELVRRYGDVIDAITLTLPADLDPDRRTELFATLRAASPAR